MLHTNLNLNWLRGNFTCYEIISNSTINQKCVTKILFVNTFRMSLPFEGNDKPKITQVFRYWHLEATILDKVARTPNSHFWLIVFRTLGRKVQEIALWPWKWPKFIFLPISDLEAERAKIIRLRGRKGQERSIWL